MSSNIVGQVVDQYGDEEFLTSPAALQLMRRGALTDPTLAAKLPDSDFALKIAGRRDHRFFPVDTPGAAELSAHYWAKADMLSPEAHKTAGVLIKRAFARHGLTETPELAEVKDDESIVFPTVREYAEEKTASAPAEEPRDVIGAAVQAFHDQYVEMSPAERTKTATMVSDAAFTAGCPDILTTALRNYTARDTVNPDLDRVMRTRAHVTGDAAGVMYGAIAKMASDDPMKVIAAIEAADKESGASLMYGQPGVPDPYRAVFGDQPIKQAAKEEAEKSMGIWAEQIGPKAWNLMRLANRPDVLKGHLGETFANNFSTRPFRVYRTATPAQKKMIDEICAGMDPEEEIPNEFYRALHSARMHKRTGQAATVSREARKQVEVGKP